MRRAAAAALARVALVLAASPAAAGPVIDEPDAIELANTLVDAAEEHGICYGWEVTILDRGTPLADVGSNLGPGVSAIMAEGCDRYIVLSVSYVWTAETSESEDSASFAVRTNVPGAPTTSDLQDLGVDRAELLARDDLTVINATLALPALATERGLGPAIPFEENDGGIPPGIGPDSTGSDLLREYGWALASFGLLVMAGAAWLVYESFIRPAQH